MAAEVPAVTWHSAAAQVLLKTQESPELRESAGGWVCCQVCVLMSVCPCPSLPSCLCPEAFLFHVELFRMVQGWCTVMITNRQTFLKSNKCWKSVRTMISPYCWSMMWSLQSINCIYTTQDYRLLFFLKGLHSLHRMPNPLFFNEKFPPKNQSNRGGFPLPGRTGESTEYYILYVFGLISGVLFQ